MYAHTHQCGPHLRGDGAAHGRPPPALRLPHLRAQPRQAAGAPAEVIQRGCVCLCVCVSMSMCMCVRVFGTRRFGVRGLVGGRFTRTDVCSSLLHTHIKPHREGVVGRHSLLPTPTHTYTPLSLLTYHTHSKLGVGLHTYIHAPSLPYTHSNTTRPNPPGFHPRFFSESRTYIHAPSLTRTSNPTGRAWSAAISAAPSTI